MDISIQQQLEKIMIDFLSEKYHLTLDKACDCLVEWKNHGLGNSAICQLLAIAESKVV